MAHSNRYSGPVETFTTTNIIRMQCCACSTWYFRKGAVNGLRIAKGQILPCNAPPMNPFAERAECESINYRIFRELEVAAMPIGRTSPQISSKRGS